MIKYTPQNKGDKENRDLRYFANQKVNRKNKIISTIR